MDTSVLAIIGGIILFIIIFFIFYYNRLTRLRNKVKQSKSGIDVFLQKRFDLIPNFVESAKAYMKHEKETLEKITELRTNYNTDKNIKTGHELNDKLVNLFATVENYPELKASEGIINLQKVLKDTENDLAAARRLYNSDVTLYNITIKEFPSNISAKIFGFHEEEFFKADEESKNNVNVEL